MRAGFARFPEVAHPVSQEAIAEYAEISGDYNPLHMDPEYAAATRFGTVIAHGPIGLQSLFEAVTRWLGTDGLPAGVSIDAAYRAPLRPGDAVSARLEDVLDHAGMLVLKVRCANQRDEPVIEALVSVPRHLAPAAQP